MANNLNITLPIVNESFYTNDSAKKNEEKIKNVIRAKYGNIINNISKITKVPEPLITSIIFIESGGNPVAHSKFASGIMQLSKATASDVIVTEKGLGRLEKPEEDILKKYLGNRWSLVEKVKPKQKSIGRTFITDKDLYQPEFSILVGSILLGMLIDEFTENGIVRLDKIISIYNGGRYSSAGKKIIKFKGSTKELLTQVPKETSDYIKKLAGANGVLETIV